MKNPIKVLMIDDQPILRMGIKAMFEDHPGIRITWETNNGKEALEIIEQEEVELVMTDVNMPIMDGIDVTKEIKQKSPEIKVLAYSSTDNYSLVIEVIKAGVDGYVLKSDGFKEIERAVLTLMQGDNYLSEHLTQKVIGNLFQRKGEHPDICIQGCEGLSNREREILVMILSGHTNKHIAHKLDLSVRTVETHRYRMMKKIGVQDTAGIFQYAIEHKLI